MIISSQFQKFIKDRSNHRYIQFVCAIILIVNVATLILSFATQVRGRTLFGPYLGADFASFYVAGSIFSSYSPEQIYDRELHTLVYRELFPDLPPNIQLPYANTPFFILPFVLLAQLPYSWAYFSWLLISIGLYVAGFTLLKQTLLAIPKMASRTLLLLALSFMPFITESLAGGQVAPFGFFWLAVALRCERRDQQAMSGIALAFCTYKPTLLLLILPMLIITKRSSILLGFVFGSMGLAFVSVLTVGWQGFLNYIDMLLYFTNASTTTQSPLRTWKYVDINSFSRLLAGGNVLLGQIISLGTAAVVLPLLFRTWQRANHTGKHLQGLAWSLTITWNLVLNIYVGIYDTIMVILSVLITINIFYEQKTCNPLPQTLPSSYKIIIFLLYITPWFTQFIAQTIHLQLYTIILTIFGLYQYTLVQDKRYRST